MAKKEQKTKKETTIEKVQHEDGRLSTVRTDEHGNITDLQESLMGKDLTLTYRYIPHPEAPEALAESKWESKIVVEPDYVIGTKSQEFLSD